MIERRARWFSRIFAAHANRGTFSEDADLTDVFCVLRTTVKVIH